MAEPAGDDAGDASAARLPPQWTQKLLGAAAPSAQSARSEIPAEVRVVAIAAPAKERSQIETASLIAPLAVSVALTALFAAFPPAFCLIEDGTSKKRRRAWIVILACGVFSGALTAIITPYM
jgi:hypothetical protein